MDNPLTTSNLRTICKFVAQLRFKAKARVRIPFGTPTRLGSSLEHRLHIIPEISVRLDALRDAFSHHKRSGIREPLTSASAYPCFASSSCSARTERSGFNVGPWNTSRIGIFPCCW
jgi:hypothetical protein